MDKKRPNEDDNPFAVVAKKKQSESGPVHVKKPLISLDAYSKHKMLINTYLLDHIGSTKKLQRDTSRDVTDLDVLKANHKFLWDETDEPDTWQKRVARKYYDKLFKEYCISDLKRYKENKIALRWRTEKEVVKGKGHFICADLNCESKDLLKSWEVNFGYIEQGDKKNALVKIRLCPDCSYKLNYHHKKKEVTQRKKKLKKPKQEKESEDDNSPNSSDQLNQSSSNETDFSQVKVKEEKDEDLTNIWSSNQPQQSTADLETNIETEMDEYLSELFM